MAACMVPLTRLLNGKEFCVINGDDEWSKEQVEEVLLQHGANIVQNPRNTTYCVIVGNDKTMRGIEVINSGKYDVVTLNWFKRVINQSEFLPWELLSSRDITRQKVAENYDEYYDSYFVNADEESLKRSFDKIEKSVEFADYQLTIKQEKEMDKELFGGTSPYSLFRDIVGFFDNESCSAKFKFRFMSVCQVIMPRKKILKKSYIKHKAAAAARSLFEELLSASQEEETVENENNTARAQAHVRLPRNLSVDLPGALPPDNFLLEELISDPPDVSTQHVDDINYNNTANLPVALPLDDFNCLDNFLLEELTSDPSDDDDDDDSLRKHLQIKSYSIIETQDEEGQAITSVVPTKWIIGDVIICPQNSKDEARATKAYLDPDSNTWKILPCKLRKTYDSYEKARQMLPRAEDTDGLDTDKGTGRGMRKKKKNILFDSDEEDHVQTKKGKALSAPPKSTYNRKKFEIRNSMSVRNVLQKLKDERMEKKNRARINTVDDGSQTEEEIIVDDVQKKRGVEDVNVELEKARKRIQDREKAKKESEREAETSRKDWLQGNPGTIENENQVLGGCNDDEIDMLRYKGRDQRGLESRSSNLSLVSPSFVEVQDEINETSRIRSNDFLISPLLSATNPADTIATSANFMSTTSSNPNFASSNWSEFPLRYNVSSSSQTRPSSALNAGYCDKETSFAFSTASGSNVNQDKISPSVSSLVLKTLISKQEELSQNFQNMNRKLDLIMDLLIRTDENVKKPKGWPTLPLADRNTFYEWELFLQNSNNYDFAVSHLSVVAGKGVNEGEMATSICKKLFSPELASGLNWTGTELKKGIKSMKCGACIIDACAKQYKGNFIKSTVTGSISAWLRSHSKKKAADEH